MCYRYVYCTWRKLSSEKDLWEIVKQSKTSPKYATDELAKEKGMHLYGID